MARKRRTYYEILEVDPTDSPDTIKKSFYNLLQRDYPTAAYPSPGKSFVKIRRLKEAYAVLSDPIKRSEYDLSLKSRDTKSSSHSVKEKTVPSLKSEMKGTAPALSNEEQKQKKFSSLASSLFTAIEKTEKDLQIQLSASDRSSSGLYLIAERLSLQVQSTLLPLFEEQKMLAPQKSNELSNASRQLAALLYRIAIIYYFADFPEEAEKHLLLSRSYFSMDAKNQQKIQKEILEKINSPTHSTFQTSTQSPSIPKSPQKVASSLLQRIIRNFPGGSFGFIIAIFVLGSYLSGYWDSDEDPGPPAVTIEESTSQADWKTGYVTNAPLLRNSGTFQLILHNQESSQNVHIKVFYQSPQNPAEYLAVREFLIRKGEFFSVEQLENGTYDLRFQFMDDSAIYQSPPFTLGDATPIAIFSLLDLQTKNSKTKKITKKEFQ